MLKSGACSNVLLWQNQLEVHHVRRLQVASETGNSLSFLFKESSTLFSLPVSLSMTLIPNAHGLEITITKRKGSWSHSSFLIDMKTYWPDLAEKNVKMSCYLFRRRKQG